MRMAFVIVLMTGGVFFVAVAAIGVVRMPDLYMRVSASTKASTLGISLILAGTALFFGDVGVTGQVVAIIAFIMLTTPVAAHMIGRAAYFSKVPLWKGSRYDELKDAPADDEKEEEQERN